VGELKLLRGVWAIESGLEVVGRLKKEGRIITILRRET